MAHGGKLAETHVVWEEVALCTVHNFGVRWIFVEVQMCWVFLVGFANQVLSESNMGLTFNMRSDMMCLLLFELMSRGKTCVCALPAPMLNRFHGFGFLRLSVAVVETFERPFAFAVCSVSELELLV